MTSTAADRPTTQSTPWFASWFDSFHYHKLYAHRDDGEATSFVDELVDTLGLDAGASVLDLGCGAGRHSRRLASKGFRVTGVDLSARSIGEARKSERPGLRFVRHDMRRPFGKDCFDYVFNFFTSFGYFDGPAEHMMVVRNMADALKAGGLLVLDYLNVRYAESRLIPAEERTIDGVTYRLTRWSDAAHFFKRIAIESGEGGEPLEYVERVAKFTLHDFEKMFADQGLRIERVFGDYHAHDYDAVTSPRMILVARKGYFCDRFLRMRLTVSGDTPRYEASIH